VAGIGAEGITMTANVRLNPVLRRVCRWPAWTVACLACCVATRGAASDTAESAIDFARDVRPLLASRCVDCHGADKQEGGLRLDARGPAFKGGDSGPVIEPGKAAESRLVHLVAGGEPETPMPPQGERLSSEQIALLRAWIDQGAAWPDDGQAASIRSRHWSLQPLRSPPVPVVSGAATEIDAFVQSALLARGLAPAAPADRRTLIRRLTFDLLGLPPTPEEVDAFLADDSPTAYDDLVERLLASPHYGERWGRHWLDVARYTESQGFEYDRLRPNAWHYRDYVIASFNADKPYDRFMAEQVAGDALQPVTRDGVVATSLLVCGPWDQAGNAQANATQKMITREDELEDMVGVVSQTFLGLTVNCARCHSHKFDPIPQEEYHRIKAVFAGVLHGEQRLPDDDGPGSDLADRRARIDGEISAATATIAALDATVLRDVAAATPAAVQAGPVPLVRWVFDGLDGQAGGAVQGAARIVDSLLTLPGGGSFLKTEPLDRDIREKTLEAWVSLADLDQRGGAAITIESGDGRQFDAIVFGERQPRRWVAGSEFFQRTVDVEGPDEGAASATFLHLAIVYRADNSIALFRNGIPYGKPYVPQSPLQTYRAGDARVLLGLRHTGSNGYLVGAVRRAALYDRALSDAEVAASFRTAGPALSQAELLARMPSQMRAERDAARARLERAVADRAALDRPRVEAVSYVGMRQQPAPTRFLPRGDVTAPRHEVTPGSLSAVTGPDADFGLPADAPEAQRRLRFASWLTDPRNPLPARVMANRVWHLHFGQGIVATPNDFGVSGAVPSHPELLDWLAARFMAGGWSVKSLHRLIVTSAVYRQSSAFDAKAAAIDADNRLLWRFAPRRLEAEAIRDAMLAASGQLNRAAGGPSFQPFATSSFGSAFYQPVDRADPEFNRRTVYRMNVNSGKDPLLDAFDCPDPAIKTPRRGVTTTPLQALELMNNSFVQRQAGHLADRGMQAAGGDVERAVQEVYRLALGREPTAGERGRAVEAARDRGLSHVCWALLNSTEFVYVR
jgi:mono/diheme cytochrome c family protein